MRASLLVLLWLAPVLPGTQAADTDIALCVLCHGTDARGNPAVRAPRLAGLEPWYLRNQIEAYQLGVRGLHADDVPGNEMRTIAVALRDPAVVEALVARIAALKPAIATRTISGDVARGAQLYASCAVCHGARGEGNAILEAPALAQGSDWYHLAQLTNFLQGRRGTHDADVRGAQMRAAASVLPDGQAAVDVVAYINTLSSNPLHTLTP